MEICQFKDIDDVIPMQPEVSFSTTAVEKLKWLYKNLTELWKEKSNKKERIFIYLAIDPKGQVDLQGHMIFYMTYKLYGLSKSLWSFCDSIQRIIREISAIESLMTSCLLDRKWHKMCFLRNKSHHHSAFTKKKFDLDPTVNNGDIPIGI